LIAPVALGGAENVLLSINRLIDKSHFNIFFCNFINPKRTRNPFVKKLHEVECDVSIIYLDRPRLDFIYVLRLARIIRSKRIDIIHSHGYMPDFFGLIASKITRRPIVSTVHGWTSSTKAIRTYEHFQKKLLRYFDIVIPVSQKISDELIKNGINPFKLRKLNNIVTFEDLTGDNVATDLNQTYITGPHTQIIGVIGRLSKEKGHIFLLQALAKIKNDFPDIKLLIIGDGDQHSKLVQFVKAHKLEHQVHFCGFQNDVSQFYRLIDIFVLPSLTEGIPLVLLEAMYFNKPIVATDVGGVPELIKNGYNGKLVPPGNPSALADNIAAILRDKLYGQTLGKAAHQSLISKNNPSWWINEIQDTYLLAYLKSVKA